jgi:RecA/RadA recombinase
MSEERTPRGSGPKSRGAAIPASEIEAVAAKWLWAERIPLGALTLLVGDPGLGKSLLTLGLAARLSRGKLGPPGVTLLVTAEDALAATVRPRLEAAGADLAHVHLYQREHDGIEEGLVLPDDVPELAHLIEEQEAKLVVIDPLAAHLPAHVNSWQDQSVRTALAPLHHAAEASGAAILVIAHLNKGEGSDPLRRIGGSIGIAAAARSVLLLARDPNDPDGERGSRRVLAHAKSNLAPLAGSLAYQIEEVVLERGIRSARLVERGPSPHTAWELLADPERRGSRLSEAIDLLEEMLSHGPRSVSELEQAAEARAIRWRTVKRAKTRLGIESQKAGFEGGWVWQLPGRAAERPAA